MELFRGYAPTQIPKDGLYDPIVLGRDLEALIGQLSHDGTACVAGMDSGENLDLSGPCHRTVTAIRAAVVMNTAHPITFNSVS